MRTVNFLALLSAWSLSFAHAVRGDLVQALGCLSLAAALLMLGRAR